MDLSGNDKIAGPHLLNKPLAVTMGFFLFLPLLPLGILLNGQETPDVQPVVRSSDGSSQKWRLLPSHSDEFDGHALDLGKWENDYPDRSGVAWEPANVFLKNGMLHLRMEFDRQSENPQKQYTSGIVRLRQNPIKFGYFEARIKAAPRFPGVCSAFWAFKNEEHWWTEIDFVELLNRTKDSKTMSFFRHVFRQPYPGLNLPYRPGIDWEAPWDPSEDFHVYGCEWDEDEIKWYVDGELVHSVINTFWDQPLDIVLSLELRQVLMDNADPDGFPTEMLVDYVRVWKKIPEDR